MTPWRGVEALKSVYPKRGLRFHSPSVPIYPKTSPYFLSSHWSLLGLSFDCAPQQVHENMVPCTTLPQLTSIALSSFELTSFNEFCAPLQMIFRSCGIKSFGYFPNATRLYCAHAQLVPYSPSLVVLDSIVLDPLEELHILTTTNNNGN